MSKNRHPDECPTCEKIPCQCPGGGAADEEKSKKDKDNDKDNEVSVDSKRNVSFMNNTVNASVLNSQQLITAEERTHSTLLNQKNQLLYCTFFASTANQPAISAFNDLQEDNTSNETNTSSIMGMKMGGMGE